MHAWGQSRPSFTALVAVACLASAALSAARAEAPVSNAELARRANQLLDLSDSTIVALDLDRTPGVTQQVTVPFFGRSIVLDLAPHSVRTDDYTLKVQVADGSIIDIEPGPVRTVRGTVRDPGGVVIGSITDAGLSALIEFADGDRYWIEPLLGRVSGAGPSDHVLYAQSDVLPNGGSCAAGADTVPLRIGDDRPPAEGFAPCVGLPCLIEIAIDTDVEYFQQFGSAQNVENHINLIFNTMNLQYERDISMVYAITTVLVRTSEPDPYSTNEAGTLLQQFTNEWIANNVGIFPDQAQLFTGKNLQGGTIGIAWSCGADAPPDCGLICTLGAFSVVQNFGALSAQTDLSAHELGHNWGRPHCSCPQHTMNPFLVSANRFHPVFSIPGLILHRETLLECLDALVPPIDFPFTDTFDGPDVDPQAWYTDTATVDDQGDGEPSGTTSLHLNGSDIITSGYTNVPSAGGVSYWWQSGGNAPGGPGPGEDMIIEYLTNERIWAEADRQLGTAPDNLPYQFGCFFVPEDATLAKFQIRVRLLNAETADSYFIDDLTITDVDELLSVDMQPILQCTCQGGTALLSAVAAGVPPFTYQWRLDGEPIPGATDDTLLIDPVGADDYGAYTVDVSNACGTVHSAEVPLQEDTPIQITAQPQDTTVAVGETLSLFVFAGGGCNTFQWFFNDEPIPGAIASFLFIPNMQCADQGCYHAELTNDCGTLTSDTAVVTVETCGPFDCQSDTAPPEIVHGTGLPGETRPFSGYIDPRSESSNGVDLNRGLTELAVLFSEPVDSVGGGPLTPDAFIVTQTGGGTPPNVTAVDTEAMPLVVLTLDRPITLQEYTTVRAVVQDQAPTPNVIVDAGDQGPGVNESDRVDIGFLPADIDQTGLVNPLDLLKFKQFVNGVQTPESGTLEDFIDTNRSGGVNPLDLLAFKQLINGVSPPATRNWAFETMNHPRP